MFKNLKNKKGFTLIELIVVVAIIGILVAVLVPTVSGYIEKARVAVVQSDAKTVYSAATTAQIEAEASAVAYQYGASATATKLLGVGVIKGSNRATAPGGYVNAAGTAFEFPTSPGATTFVTGIEQGAVGRFKGGNALTGADLTASVSFEDALKKFADNAVTTLGSANVLFFFA